MKVKSIAECSPWIILQYFWPAQAILRLENLFSDFLQWPFYTGFTVLPKLTTDFLGYEK